MESGRFIAGRSASFLVTVDNVKMNHGKMFAVTDGGTNCNASAIGSGQVLKRNFKITNVSGRAEDKTNVYNISGPLCTPDDLLGRDVEIQEIREGDILAVSATGAYGPTASPALFHSHGYPAEVIHNHGKMVLIRRRDTADDIKASHVHNKISDLLGSNANVEPITRNSELDNDIQRTLVKYLREILRISPDKSITANSHLRDDLGLDSLTSVQILIGLEDDVEGFIVNPETIEPRCFNTVETLSNYVQETVLYLQSTQNKQGGKLRETA
jgi:diaminopimelate decarboxylase